MRFVITAGPTREHLDPVRFLSNPSTGKMGFALAAAAARRGHDVTLVAGPVALKTPRGVTRIDVTSALDMLAAADRALAESSGETAFVSSAAVADWRPARVSPRKLKKTEMSSILRLERNPDILGTLRARYGRRTDLSFVGFAAETDRVLEEAARKCREKGLRFIVANDVTEKGSGFGTDTDRVTFVFPDGRVMPLPLQSKLRVAAAVIREIETHHRT